MSSLSTGPPGTQSIEALKDALYARCSHDEVGKEFTTEELLNLGIIPREKHEILMQCTQRLLTERLFKVLRHGDGFVFTVVKREDAARYNSLSADEEMIFSNIESAGHEGIWTRTINLRTNLHTSVVMRSLKNLESKGFIKSVQSVKFPTRKIYMLASLTPSEDVTGGPWFTDGELDTEFVKALCDLLYKFVRSKSFYQAPVLTSTSSTGPTAKRVKSNRPQTDTTKRPLSSSNTNNTNALLPFPPSYTAYPTLFEIMSWINNSGVTQVPLADEHVRQLMDILYYDKRVERVNGGKAFIAVRNPPASDDLSNEVPLSDPGRAANAFTEAPCGRCPVFNLCEEGGPVSASKCVYFKDWLELD